MIRLIVIYQQAMTVLTIISTCARRFVVVLVVDLLFSLFYDD